MSFDLEFNKKNNKLENLVVIYENNNYIFYVVIGYLVFLLNILMVNWEFL